MLHNFSNLFWNVKHRKKTRKIDTEWDFQQVKLIKRMQITQHRAVMKKLHPSSLYLRAQINQYELETCHRRVFNFI